MRVGSFEEGHLTVNNTHEVYPGWHGGPTRSESEVPLVFAFPGNHHVSYTGELRNRPLGFYSSFLAGKQAANVKADGHLRNWYLTPVLESVMSHYRNP